MENEEVAAAFDDVAQGCGEELDSGSGQDHKSQFERARVRRLEIAANTPQKNRNCCCVRQPPPLRCAAGQPADGVATPRRAERMQKLASDYLNMPVKALLVCF